MVAVQRFEAHGGPLEGHGFNLHHGEGTSGSASKRGRAISAGLSIARTPLKLQHPLGRAGVGCKEGAKSHAAQNTCHLRHLLRRTALDYYYNSYEIDPGFPRNRFSSSQEIEKAAGRQPFLSPLITRTD